MDVGDNKTVPKNCLWIIIAVAFGIAAWMLFCLGTGADVRDQRIGADAVGRELEHAIDHEQRAARETRELAGEAENLGDELGTVREKLEDARREVGLVVEGNDRADSLIGECQQIIAGVRARGTKNKETY